MKAADANSLFDNSVKPTLDKIETFLKSLQ